MYRPIAERVAGVGEAGLHALPLGCLLALLLLLAPQPLLFVLLRVLVELRLLPLASCGHRLQTTHVGLIGGSIGGRTRCGGSRNGREA